MEVARAEKEPGYGTDASKSDLDPYMQGVSHRNSAFSQLKFSEYTYVHLGVQVGEIDILHCSLSQALYPGSIWPITRITARTESSQRKGRQSRSRPAMYLVMMSSGDNNSASICQSFCFLCTIHLHSIPLRAALFEEPANDIDLTCRYCHHDDRLDNAVVEDLVSR